MIRKILPTILATLTGQPRYLPDIVWSSNSWVHNIFRFYEMIFWRRIGIRAESGVFDRTIVKNNRKVNVKVIELYSIESIFAYTETAIRKFITDTKNFKLPVKLYIPVLQTNTISGMGTGLKLSPYLFAIAFENSVGFTFNASASNITYSKTCTGSDLILWVGTSIRNSRTIAGGGVTYNSISLTQSGTASDSTAILNYLHYKTTPSTGANTVSVTQSVADTITSCAISYTGVNATGQPDATSVGGPSTATSYSQSVTSVADNCFAILYGNNNSGASITAGSNTTVRNNCEVAFCGACLCDSTTAKTPAGTFTLAFTSASGSMTGTMASFAPVSVATVLSAKVVRPLQAINRASTY